MHSVEVAVDLNSGGLTDITDHVQGFCAGLGDGLVNVFAPHSTVGLALVQTGGGSSEDLRAALDRLIPRDLDYVHQDKAPGHGADHILPLLVSPTLTIPVEDGVPLLGSFQQIVFIDLDEEPSERRVRMSFVAG